jgi:hypothetical protein
VAAYTWIVNKNTEVLVAEFESAVPQISSTQLTEILDDVNTRFGLEGSADIASPGPTSIVSINSPEDPSAERRVTRLVYSHNPQADMDATRRDLQIMSQLRAHGAQLPDFDPEPFLVSMPNGNKGALIGTLSEYLPESYVQPYHHGKALASTHNASLHVDLGDLKVSNALDDWYMGDVLDYLEQRDEPFEFDEVKISSVHLAVMRRKYNQANETREQLNELGKRNGTPYVAVQEDVHNENVRGMAPANIDPTGKLIDMLPLRRGLAAIDIGGRPRNDWTPHFGRPIEERKGLEAGYVDHIYNAALPHPAELELAADYTQIRSSLVFIAIAVRNALTGVGEDPWLLRQGLHRVDVIEDRQASWAPLDDDQKQAGQGAKGE